MTRNFIIFKFLLNTFKHRNYLNNVYKKKDTLSDMDYFTELNKVGSMWAEEIIKSTGSTVEVIGEENIIRDRSIVIMANHQSNLDIPVLIRYLDIPISFVSKIEISKVPILSKAMREIHCVFLDRSDIKQSALSIIQSIDTVKKGYSMCIFPEGTRSKDGNMGEFKKGAFKLATKSKAPILPITINGISGILENNTKNIIPGKIHLTIHKPIFTENLSKVEVSNLPDVVRGVIKNSYNKTTI